MNTKTDPLEHSPLTTTVTLLDPWRWGVPLFAILALAVLLALGDNVPLFMFMNGVMSNANDGLWIHLSLLADGLLVTLYVLPFLGRRPDVVWQYILATFVGGIFVHGMKEIFSTMRPPAILNTENLHLIGPALQNNAFPSGHTTVIFVLAGLVCLQRFEGWGKAGVMIKFAALLLAIFVGFSRIASGVHWPLDVLGAAAGGWLVAIVSVWLSQRWRAGFNIWVQRVFAAIFTPLSVWSVWFLWQNLDNVYPGTGLMKVTLLVACLALSVPGQLRLFNIRQ